MARLHQLLETLLEDRRITKNEVEVIRQSVQQDGKLDMEDVKFLVQLLSEADEVCPEFDALFFPVLKEVILKDGKIGMDEQFYLLKMLYSDGRIRDSEMQFLLELQREATDVPAEFDELIETAMKAAPTGWDVGGQPRQGASYAR